MGGKREDKSATLLRCPIETCRSYDVRVTSSSIRLHGGPEGGVNTQYNIQCRGCGYLGPADKESQEF